MWNRQRVNWVLGVGLLIPMIGCGGGSGSSGGGSSKAVEDDAYKGVWVRGCVPVDDPAIQIALEELEIQLGPLWSNDRLEISKESIRHQVEVYDDAHCEQPSPILEILSISYGSTINGYDEVESPAGFLYRRYDIETFVPNRYYFSNEYLYIVDPIDIHQPLIDDNFEVNFNRYFVRATDE